MGRLLALLFLLTTSSVLAQDEQPTIPPPEEGESFELPSVFDSEQMDRIEQLAREGALPDYEDLRLPPLDATDLQDAFLLSLPLLRGELVDDNLVFPEVPTDSSYAQLDLQELVDLALQGNFDLLNSRRGVAISRSEVRGSEAFFLPFLDLIGDARIAQTERRQVEVQPPFVAPTPDPDNPEAAANFVPPAPQIVRQRSTTDTIRGGAELRQNLGTGGTITGQATQARSRTRVRDPFFATDSELYDSDAEIRFLQPLLRGSGLLTGEGTAIGTANLRSARLSELDVIIADRLRQRDIVLQVIQQYFQILQAKQNLLISRDAIQKRFRFLDETRIKFDVGRVAESEILSAQIQFLQEIETAIGRIQALDDSRESLLLLLGLPLDTPISLVDITADLRARGRFELPTLDESLDMANGSRWELMRSDISIAQAEINRLVARNERLPDLNVDAGYRRFDSGSTYEEADDWRNDTYDAGASLRIPLQNIQQREAHRRSIMRVEQEETNRLALDRSITQEVLAAHRAVLTNEARLTVSRQRVEQARRNLELINSSFEVGFSTVTEVRLAQDDLFDAETAYSNSVLSYQTNIARFYITVGLPLY